MKHQRSRKTKTPKGMEPMSSFQIILTTLAAGLILVVVNPLNIDLSSERADEPVLSPGVKPYPLKVCLVSADRLDAMGKPQVLEHEGQQVKFCCKSCVKEFQAEPAKFLAKLKEITAG